MRPGIAIAVFALIISQCASNAGVLDVFDSHNTKAGKSNDAWFSENKDRIKATFTTLEYGSRTETNYSPKTVKRWMKLNGTFANTSDQKITAIIMEIALVNPTNRAEFMKERIKIFITVYKGETLTMPAVQELSLDQSELPACMKRLPQCSWTYDVVAVITDKTDFGIVGDLEYYKYKSSWEPFE